ncbi:unnamed protein product [Lymnaea stagnalis]|uniref:SOCS box domain-containing protein n=1 Tax=Lymnaea stagnalis TaxID=6523 RepID=A0AAV2HU91_LYMST
MGNTLTFSSHSKKKPQVSNKIDFYKLLTSSATCDELMSCSFGSWCRDHRFICGFSDQADYTSNRQPLLQLNGSLNKPDTMEGRFFRCGFKIRNELMIFEKEALRCLTVQLPRETTPEMTAYFHRHRPRRRRRSIRTARVVAYHDGTIIVQLNSDRHPPFTKFFIINLEQQKCCGQFILYNSLRRWYEVYISPSSTHIVLRPDVRYQFQANINYHIQVIKSYTSMPPVIISKMAVLLPHHSFTYNKQLGDEDIIAAGNRSIKIYKTSDWSVTSQYILPISDATIQQIRSSPTGDYLAVRYTFPANGYCYNHILILHYPDFSEIMHVDIRGTYWPVSELINVQVFPRFSLSESCFAVIKQRNYGRKVFIYKLPTELRSLQDLCRRAILHLVTPRDISKLPLPSTVQKYLSEHPT